MRIIHAVTSRNAARALDAARLRSRIEGYEPCFETKGQWLPCQMESPMEVPSSSGTCRAAPAEAEVHGSPGPRIRSLTERPFCICGPGCRATQQQQQMDVAQLEEHRSPKPAAGGSIPSVHANRGRSHGHRTRDLAERLASNVAPG